MNLTFITSCILSLSLLLQAPLEDAIPWSDVRRLSWADFKAKPDPFSSNAALTSSKISFVYNQNPNNFKYKISCHFNRSASWGKVRTTSILAHEQGHFDISEIHARKLNKALRLYKIRPTTLISDVSAIYEVVMQGQNNMQSDYDSETDFSRNYEQQLAWQKKIQAELVSLQVYGNYTTNQ
jgi:hypothetical protein